MKLFKKRIFNLKWQYFLIIIPFLVIPLLVLVFAKFLFYNNIKNENLVQNDILLYQVINNIDSSYTKNNPDIIKQSLGKLEFKKSDFYSNGLIIIFDKNNTKLFSNFNDMESGIKSNFDEKLIINNSIIQKILNNNLENINHQVLDQKTLFIDSKVGSRSYYLFLLDSSKLSDMINNLKIMYLFPKSDVSGSINLIIFLLFIISIILLSVVIFLYLNLCDLFIYPIQQLNNITRVVKEGNLNVDLLTESNDEIADLFVNFKNMINSHKDILINIHKSSYDLTGYQNSLDKEVNLFNEKLNDQHSNVLKNSRIFDKFESSTKKMNTIIRDAQGIINQAQKNSNLSTKTINEMIDEINKMLETSQEINYIIDLINGISEKTRLLSVNSAIEASRAGEVGKGFGVVATEIRKLAVQSKDAASKIGSLIKNNDKKISSGITKSYEVIEALRNVDSSIKFINEIVEQINISINEEKVDTDGIKDLNNYYSNNITENLESVSSITRLKRLFNMEVDKIKDFINKIRILQQRQKNSQRHESNRRIKERSR